MGTVEIVLLVIGIICVIVGIILGITDNNDHDKDMNPAVSDYDAASQVSKVSQTIDNIIEQKMQDIEDKTEARLDKLSNTKILEMNEYADGVLKEINRNHNEVMFLYNMLNDKETTLKNTVRDIEAVKVSVRKMADNVENDVQAWENEIKFSPEEETVPAEDKEERPSQEAVPEIEDAEEEDQRSNKEKILELYRQGKSNIEIAKQLNLGVGEVNLVLGLFKG